MVGSACKCFGPLGGERYALDDPLLPLLFRMRSAFPIAIRSMPIWLNRYNGAAKEQDVKAGSRELLKGLERETGIEPATSSLGSWHSTAELLPLGLTVIIAMPKRSLVFPVQQLDNRK
jgi:hypothetical protein